MSGTIYSLEDLIESRDAYLDQELEAVDTEWGILRKHSVVRWYGGTYTITKLTLRGWAGLSADTSLEQFFSWQWSIMGSSEESKRRVVSAPYPLEQRDWHMPDGRAEPNRVQCNKERRKL